MGKIKKISTAGMSRPEWLEMRRNSIGGSDAAAIVGISKWSTPMTVWADKTGRLPDKPDSEAMRIGRDLEDYVSRRWMEETGKRAHRVNAMLYNQDYPFAHADIDRAVSGESAGLECKTTSDLDIKQFKDVEFPEKYYVQCVHYLAVTGFDRWYLAVLVFGRGFNTFTLERDEAEIQALMEAERSFWELVQSDTPPAPDGKQPTADALETIYHSAADAQTVQLFGRESLLREWSGIRTQMDALKERKTEIENILKLDMKEAERAECIGYRVSWKRQARRNFQTERFREDHSELDLTPYIKETETRVFRIAEDKEETQK